MRIVHISDLHYERMPARLFGSVPQSLARCKAILRALEPDLVIVSGDLTSYGCWDVREMYAAKNWLDALGIPFLAVPGNHDLSANPAKGVAYPLMEHYEELPFDETNFGRVFGQPPVKVLEFQEATVVGFGIRDHDPDGTLEALAAAIDAASSPVLTVGHYPLEPVREKGFLAQFGALGYLDAVQPQLRETIADRPRVVAHLCGHVHVASVRTVDDRLAQFSAGAVGPGASRGWILDTNMAGFRFAAFGTGGPDLFWPETLLAGQDAYDQHWEVPSRRLGQLLFSFEEPSGSLLAFLTE